MNKIFCLKEEKQYICITKFCHDCHYFGKTIEDYEEN